jgi:hypothetical protein
VAHHRDPETAAQTIVAWAKQSVPAYWLSVCVRADVGTARNELSTYLCAAAVKVNRISRPGYRGSADATQNILA